jgi:hypothetical protein
VLLITIGIVLDAIAVASDAREMRPCAFLLIFVSSWMAIGVMYLILNQLEAAF